MCISTHLKIFLIFFLSVLLQLQLLLSCRKPLLDLAKRKLAIIVRKPVDASM